MTDEARKVRAQVMREWRKKNPDKIRAATERYWERRAQREKEQEAVKNGITKEKADHPNGR